LPIQRIALLLERLARFRMAVTLALVLAIIVAIATLTPGERLPSAPGTDKLHHFLGFGALAFPLALARPRAILWIVLLVSAYGALIELVQPYFGRDRDLADAVANTFGAIVGAISGRVLRLRVLNHRTPRK
jgi:VanZ family protein